MNALRHLAAAFQDADTATPVERAVIGALLLVGLVLAGMSGGPG